MAPWTLPQVRARPRHSCDSRATESTQREADARGRETGNRRSTRGSFAQCVGSHGLGQALQHATYRAFFPRASGQIPTCLMTSRVQTGGFQGHHAGGGVRHSVTRPPMQEVRLCKGTQDSRHQILTASPFFLIWGEIQQKSNGNRAEIRCRAPCLDVRRL